MTKLIFLYLALFPFGQLLKYRIFNLTDIVVGIICFVFIFYQKRKLIPIPNYFKNFFAVAFFSLIFSTIFFPLNSILNGSLYALRFLSYVIFSQVIWMRFGRNEKKKKLIIGCLLIVGLFVAVFGWIQYFIYPDLRALKDLGWDDHYYRLASTYLDPAFTGIILVLTEILVIIKTVNKRSLTNTLLNIFLIITIAFTYSRSSYIALLVSLLFVYFKYRKKFLIYFGILFLLIIPFLPRPSGEGVNLTRTYSVNEKFKNYKESITLFSKSPIFGIGFNNVCAGRQQFLNDENVESHACSGLDNSIFFILVTTGIAGSVVFLFSIKNIISETQRDETGFALLVSLAAILIHGSFTNTFFYSFVLGWIAILIGATRKAQV